MMSKQISLRIHYIMGAFHTTADKREIEGSREFPSATSFIGETLHEIANQPICLMGFKR